jgi:hypothetical protein
VLSLSSRSHSTIKHISHDRLYSNYTHPHCRSPARPRAVSPARLQLVLYGRSAFLCHSLQQSLVPIVELFLPAPIRSPCRSHLCIVQWQLRLNPTSSYPHALQSNAKSRGASIDPRRPGMLKLESLSCWIYHFRMQAGEETAENQLATFTDPAGTAATAAWHVFQCPVSIVPPTFQPENWCSAHCLALLHIPVRAANPSSAAQLPRHMSKLFVCVKLPGAILRCDHTWAAWEGPRGLQFCLVGAAAAFSVSSWWTGSRSRLLGDPQRCINILGL